MKILILNASPKKNGNLAKILKALNLGFINKKLETEYIDLVDLKIADCLGCMVCQTKGQCFIRDDIEKVEQGILNADILVLGTPTHWGNLSGIMLRTIERLFGFLITEQIDRFPLPQKANHKKAILVTTCSTRWPFDWVFNQSRAVFSRFKEICKYSGIKIIKKITYPDTKRKEHISEKELEKFQNYPLYPLF